MHLQMHPSGALLVAAAYDAPITVLNSNYSTCSTHHTSFCTTKGGAAVLCRANFLRAYDGHVALQNRYTKAWTDIKCDLQVPGLLLLRDASGEVGVSDVWLPVQAPRLEEGVVSGSSS